MTQPLLPPMQQPATGTAEITESFTLLTACPVCHTCPVCQANCGTSRAMKCCTGKMKQEADCAPGECGSDAQTVRHVMTNKADAVKHAATRTPSDATTGQGAPRMVQTGSGVLIIETTD